jgi:ribosomal protein L12E/L44/L45/RPP1/RPP2
MDFTKTSDRRYQLYNHSYDDALKNIATAAAAASSSSSSSKQQQQQQAAAAAIG